jgi:hypothetical protein
MTTQALVAPTGNAVNRRAPSTHLNSTADLHPTHSTDSKVLEDPHPAEEADQDEHPPTYEASNNGFDRDQDLDLTRTQASHESLPAGGLRCMVAPSRQATWLVKGTNMGLCTMATTVLLNEGILDPRDLET